MAANNPENDETCTYFCGEILGDLPEELKKNVITVLHKIIQKGYKDLFSACTRLLIKLKEVDPFRYSVILKQLCLSLLIIKEDKAAEKLVEARRKELTKEDYFTLTILGVVQEKKGDYEKALASYKRANASAEENENEVQKIYSLLKLATSQWNLGNREESCEYFCEGKNALDNLDPSADTSEEEKVLLTDCYKTVGYLSKIRAEYSNGAAYCSRALAYLKENGCSVIQEVKVLTQLAICYAQTSNETLVEETNSRSVQIIEEVLQNSAYVSAHVTQVLHLMSRISFAYKVMGNEGEALCVYKKSLKIAMNHLCEAHPEVARIAVDIALLWYQEDDALVWAFIALCEKSLRLCGYEKDQNKMKLYVREISDALADLAYCYSLKAKELYKKAEMYKEAVELYKKAEELYQKALDVTDTVYGDGHLRTAKVMQYLGRMYMCQRKKKTVAKKYLKKALSIVKKYQPDNTKFIDSIQKDLDKIEVALSGRR